jgi:hypothetical protein
MGSERTGRRFKLAGGRSAMFVWLPLLDFTSGELRRSIVPSKISRKRTPQQMRATHA